MAQDSDERISPEDIVKHCDGSYSKAVDLIMSFGRILWNQAYPILPKDSEDSKEEKRCKILETERLLAGLQTLPEVVSTLLLPQLYAEKNYAKKNIVKLCWDIKGQGIGFQLYVFNPVALVREFLSGLKPEHDLSYFVFRNIRKTYRKELSSETAHLMHLLADAINTKFLSASRDTSEKRSRRHYQEDILPCLRAALKSSQDASANVERDIEWFIECCRAVGYLNAEDGAGQIHLRTAWIDAEYLISHLYGMPTGILGFDELFGKGGLILTENLDDLVSRASRLNGRTVLIMGRYGTGKSLLSMQLAIEVARKGGVAWIMPLEQTDEECLYTLRSMNILPTDGSVIIAKGMSEAIRAMRAQKDKSEDKPGALIFLRSPQETFESFLEELEENSELLGNYSLRLLCVDPISSISRTGMEDRTKQRSVMRKSLETIKNKRGVNVILVGEAGDSGTGRLPFEQNIADTVIHLSVHKRHHYAHRYFEITKSRLQREHRGEHSFSIRPGEGLRIYPSAAAIYARTLPRIMHTYNYAVKAAPIKIGIPSLDLILGRGAVTAGDVIAFQGPGGSFKSPLSIFFMLGTDGGGSEDQQRPARSLLIAARDDEQTLRRLLSQKFVSKHRADYGMTKAPDNIQICALPQSYVEPGVILQRIEDEFIKADLNGYRIDRVVVDDVAHLETSCPFVRDDETFGDTLVDFLRSHRVSSLFICGKPSPNLRHVVQQPILDKANCIIQFEKREYMGKPLVLSKIIETRALQLYSGLLEVVLDPPGIDLRSSLLREEGGELKPIKIRLFLPLQNEKQKEYYERFAGALRESFSEDTTLETEPKERLYVSKALGLNSMINDELRILHLDEFELPVAQKKSLQHQLFWFPHDTTDVEWENSFLHFKDRSSTLSPLFRLGDLRDSLADSLRDPQKPLSQYLQTQFTSNTKQLLEKYDGSYSLPEPDKKALVDEFNKLIKGPFLYDKQRFTGVKLTKETKKLIAHDLHPEEIIWLNRLLLEEAYPNEIVRNRKYEYFAIPFYEDLGLLAFRQDILNYDVTDSWQSLAEECAQWESKNTDPQLLFFDFARTSNEDYNCLFFEILLSLEKQPPDGEENYRIQHLLDSRAAIQAGKIYRQLCRRAYYLGGIGAGSEAVVWRCWYTSLNAILSRISIGLRDMIQVRLLPKDVTVAGDSYLGIQASSIAPDIGLSIIKRLTTTEAELDRYHQGMGLPIRSKFYEDRAVYLSEKFSISARHLRDVLHNGFRRSSVKNYPLFSQTLTQYLHRIITLPDDNMEENIKLIFESLKREIDIERRIEKAKNSPSRIV